MLLKLLKYDFRAMWKHFSLIWGAALAMALVNRMTHSIFFMIRIGDHDGNIGGFTLDVLLIVLMVMFVICISFILRQFSRGLLGNEGYLMHTLPVRTWQLVTSKLACAIAACIISAVVALMAILLMYTTDFWELFDIHILNLSLRVLREKPDFVVMLLESCLLLLSIMVDLIAVIYLAISIGHFFSRFRRVISVASFIGLYILVSYFYNWLFAWEPLRSLKDAAMETTHGALLTASAIILLPAAVFLAAVCWILENKLNLE